MSEDCADNKWQKIAQQNNPFFAARHRQGMILLFADRTLRSPSRCTVQKNSRLRGAAGARIVAVKITFDRFEDSHFNQRNNDDRINQ